MATYARVQRTRKYRKEETFPVGSFVFPEDFQATAKIFERILFFACKYIQINNFYTVLQDTWLNFSLIII